MEEKEEHFVEGAVRSHNDSKLFDDDDRLKRTGTLLQMNSFSLYMNLLWWSLKMWRDRYGLDDEFAHNNSSGRIRSVVVGMGYSSVGLGNWSFRHAFLQSHHLVYFITLSWMLSNWRSSFRKKKLYFHGSCSHHSR